MKENSILKKPWKQYAKWVWQKIEAGSGVLAQKSVVLWEKTKKFYHKAADFKGRRKALIAKWEQSALQGNIEAAYKLAMLYFEEEKEFYPLAFKWTEILAQQSEDCGVMLQLARMYELGEGTSQDVQKALDWYEKCLSTHIIKGKESHLSVSSENYVQQRIVSLREYSQKTN